MLEIEESTVAAYVFSRGPFPTPRQLLREEPFIRACFLYMAESILGSPYQLDRFRDIFFGYNAARKGLEGIVSREVQEICEDQERHPIDLI